MKRRAFLSLLPALPLAGCGFELRGAHAIPYRSIYLAASKGGSENTYETYDGSTPSTVHRESIVPKLTKALRAQGVTIAASPKEADAVLRISQEKQNRSILSLSGGGRVREYRLNYTLNYSLTGKDEREIYPETTILSSRDFTYDDNQYLAKAAEESFLYRDLQEDAVQQILRRLARPN